MYLPVLDESKLPAEDCARGCFCIVSLRAYALLHRNVGCNAADSRCRPSPGRQPLSARVPSGLQVPPYRCLAQSVKLLRTSVLLQPDLGVHLLDSTEHTDFTQDRIISSTRSPQPDVCDTGEWRLQRPRQEVPRPLLLLLRPARHLR